MNAEHAKEAISRIIEARGDQDNCWGEQQHDFPVWGLVLSEEVGELSQEMLRLRERISGASSGIIPPVMVRNQLLSISYEAAQVGAVAMAIIERCIAIQGEKLEDDVLNDSLLYVNFLAGMGVEGFR